MKVPSQTGAPMISSEPMNTGVSPQSVRNLDLVSAQPVHTVDSERGDEPTTTGLPEKTPCDADRKKSTQWTGLSTTPLGISNRSQRTQDGPALAERVPFVTENKDPLSADFVQGTYDPPPTQAVLDQEKESSPKASAAAPVRAAKSREPSDMDRLLAYEKIHPLVGPVCSIVFAEYASAELAEATKHLSVAELLEWIGLDPLAPWFDMVGEVPR